MRRVKVTHVLLLDLRLLLRGEVVDNVEKLPDFLGGLSLYHVRHSFATDIAVHAAWLVASCTRGHWVDVRNDRKLRQSQGTHSNALISK